MSTAPVARDVVEIFERHGEWREAEARRILASHPRVALSKAESDEILERTKYRQGQEMLQYRGVVSSDSANILFPVLTSAVIRNNLRCHPLCIVSRPH